MAYTSSLPLRSANMTYMMRKKRKKHSGLKCHYDQISTSWKNENAIYRLQIPALVPEIFKFEKCVKYANKMTDDVIHSTQYFIKCINRGNELYLSV